MTADSQTRGRICAERTAVYRFFNAAGDLLYVGMSKSAAKREGEHSREKPWWPEVATTTVEWFEERERAAWAEGQAILNEGPRWNVLGPAQHGTESCYTNNGCRRPECIAAFSAAQKVRRGARLYGPGKERGPEWQQRILEDLAATRDVKVTAENLGVNQQAITGARRSLPDTFGAEVDRLTAWAD